MQLIINSSIIVYQWFFDGVIVIFLFVMVVVILKGNVFLNSVVNLTSYYDGTKVDNIIGRFN